MSWSWSDIWPFLAIAVNAVVAIAATTHALLHKRDPRAALAWVALVWLSPVVGSLLYLCLGVNRIQRKAVSLQLDEQWQHPRYLPLEPSELEEKEFVKREYPNWAAHVQMIEELTGRPILPGNSVRPLVDGDEAYPEMLAAIDSAQKSISLLSYIFDNDRVGKEFLKRLAAAEKRGVEVRVLIDGVGARYSRPTMVKEMQAAGVAVAVFLPTRTPRLFKYANMRNHRKLLVVDGCTGFTGGTNIREGHQLRLKPGFPVRCLHFRFEGPVVAHLQEVFAMDWAFVTGESLDGDVWFPAIERAGHVWARGISGGPDEDLDKLPLTMIGALGAARDSISIVTPYFLPEQPILQALYAAALRGVDVRIVVPSHNNILPVQWASSTLMPYLLERGCRIYLSPPPFDHTKLLLVDSAWQLVGSTNWDPRSLRLNFEFNVECYSLELGKRLGTIVTQRLQESREVTLEDCLNQKLPVRLRNGFARLFTPYL